MLESRQDGLFTRLFNLSSEKHLIENGVDFVKVEDEVELRDVAEKGVEDLDEEVNSL